MKKKNGVLIAGLSLFTIVFLLFRDKNENSFTFSSSEISSLSTHSGLVQKETRPKSESQQLPSDMPDFANAEKQYLNSVKANANEPPAFSSVLDAESDKTIKEFSQLTKIEFSPPAKMRFMKMDLTDDGLEGVFGRAEDDSSGLAVIATAKLPPQGEVRKFLLESHEDFPNLSNKEVGWSEKAQEFPAPAESGFGVASVWTGQDVQGNSYAAVLLHRQDGKGSYFFVYDHTGSEVFENDGYFDKLFSETKAVEF